MADITNIYFPQFGSQKLGIAVYKRAWFLLSLVKETLFMPLSCSSAYKWYSPLSSPLCIDFSVSESFPALRYSPKHCIFLAAPLRQEDPSSPTGG